ncbi:hypothetical protein [Microbacterium hydrothermale]|uniref:hypothetical protein n=1 Tax=Microbacterium hydrothermale TaxID=857427 RepID=UPI00222621DE|nr:hypothetical protein [Microbacterium hydrothermale]
MTSQAMVIARYDEVSRAAHERTLRRLVRTQGTLLLVLGSFLGVTVLLPFVALAIDTGVDAAYFLALAVLLVAPIAIVVFGMRQLRRQVRTPEVAVTITPAAVLFPAIERPSALAPRVRAEEWPREGTTAEIVPTTGPSAVRIEFTRRDAGKRRRRSVAAGNLDVDPRVIVEALKTPPIQSRSRGEKGR